MRHMAGGDVRAGRFDVVMGIVEEDVGAKGLQKRPLVAPTKEQCLVQSHPPLAQGKDHALVRRCRASGDQRGANRRVLGRKCRSEEHTSELQSLMRITYAVFCLKKKINKTRRSTT